MSDQVAVVVDFKYGNKDYWDYGRGQWLMTAIESLNDLIKAQLEEPESVDAWAKRIS